MLVIVPKVTNDAESERALEEIVDTVSADAISVAPLLKMVMETRDVVYQRVERLAHFGLQHTCEVLLDDTAIAASEYSGE